MYIIAVAEKNVTIKDVTRLLQSLCTACTVMTAVMTMRLRHPVTVTIMTFTIMTGTQITVAIELLENMFRRWSDCLKHHQQLHALWCSHCSSEHKLALTSATQAARATAITHKWL
jgi:hypothetical protein